MAITLEAAARNAACNAIVDLLNNGTVDVRASTTVLATCTLNPTAFGDASSGTATANAITGDSSINADGTADNFQVKTSDPALLFSGSAGGPSSGADMEISPSASLVETGTFAISAFTVTMPAS